MIIVLKLTSNKYCITKYVRNQKDISWFCFGVFIFDFDLI